MPKRNREEASSSGGGGSRKRIEIIPDEKEDVPIAARTRSHQIVFINDNDDDEDEIYSQQEIHSEINQSEDEIDYDQKIYSDEEHDNSSESEEMDDETLAHILQLNEFNHYQPPIIGLFPPYIQHRVVAVNEQEIDFSYEGLWDLADRVGSVKKKGASKQIIDSLPIIFYDEIEGDKQCTVCLYDIEESDTAKKIYCGHTFHQPCIEKWLEMNASCPVCRVSLDE